jgi:single-stranded DNA-binding protein
MQSQLYLTGKLVAQPELLQTKNGKTLVRLLLETELVRPTVQGGFQAEAVILPVSFFSREAETVKDCHRGDSLAVGVHLYGTEFKAPNGVVKRGVQIIADQILQGEALQKESYR